MAGGRQRRAPARCRLRRETCSWCTAGTNAQAALFARTRRQAARRQLVSPILRAAEMYDAKALARIHASCFAEAWDVEALRRFIEKPGMLALVAKDAAENDLQAFILVQIAADESEIISLATYTPARRSGLAHALLAQAIAEAT